MLIINRQVGEAIKLDENVTITIMSIKAGKVRIGIDAPKQIDVARDDMVKGPPTNDLVGYKDGNR